MQQIPPSDSHEPSAIPDSNRLKLFEGRWLGLKEVATDPNTPPWARVFIVTFGTLGITFLGLSWATPPWFVYIIIAACFLVVCILAYFARQPSKIQSPPKPRPQSEGKGTVIRTPEAH